MFAPDMEAATTDQILPMITHNLGIGFYPEELAAEAIARGSAYAIRLVEPIPEREICLVTNSSTQMSAAVRAAGLMGSFFYENGNENPNGFIGLLIAFFATLIVAALGGLIYSFLTITLRANQNVVGLALTTFGVGFGNFFGGSISKLAGGVGQISVQTTAAAFRAKIPGLSAIPVIGDLLFSYGFLTYLSVILAVCMTYFLKKTRRGLNLRAVGESPATADAAGINVSRYQYVATVTGAL